MKMATVYLSKKAVNADSQGIGNIHTVFQNTMLLKGKLANKNLGVSVFQFWSAFQE